ncbi:MAG TPA: amidase [Tepidisphaeraceae bacterium]
MPSRVRIVAAVTAALVLGGLTARPTEAAFDIIDLSITDALAGMTGGQYTSAELTQAYLDRIKAFDPTYNAFVSMNPDALAQAQAIDARRAAGLSVGPLAGVPIVIKDNMDYAGLVTTNGFKGFSSKTGGIDLKPAQDATMVARLKAAGAIIIGKTNLPDFAGDGTRTISTVDGRTVNPLVPNKVPGGSSGGSAVAVNGSFAIGGMGTETGTSIHNPATFNNIVGVRPTQGLVPIDGIYPLSGTFRDVTGPLTTSVRDAALMLNVVAGRSPRDRLTNSAPAAVPDYTANLTTAALAGMRIGSWDESFSNLGNVKPFVAQSSALYNNALNVIGGLGATVDTSKYLATRGWTAALTALGSEPASSAFDVNSYLSGTSADTPFKSVAEYNALIDAMYPDADPLTRGGTAQAYVDRRDDLRDLFEDILDAADLDGLVFPVHTRPLVNALDADREIGTVSGTVNILGIPGVIVNAGHFMGDADGDGDDDTTDPFSLIFLGRRFDEADILSYAYAFEQAFDSRIVPTLIPEPTTFMALFGGSVLLLARRRQPAA